jgi:hypothetical protein
MKHIFTLAVAAVCAACHLSAAEFNYKRLDELKTAGDYTKLEAGASEMKSAAKLDGQKYAVIHYITFARQKLGRYADTAAVLADVEALGKELGLTAKDDAVQAAKLFALYDRGENAYAIELSAGWTGPKTLHRRGLNLASLKRFAEATDAYAAAAAAGSRGSWVSAAKTAIHAKLPAKCYEYALAAFANGAVRDPASGITLVNAVIDADYSGTAITSAKVKELLQTVNRKYSRKLVVGSPSKWDELIQLVRQTLETY